MRFSLDSNASTEKYVHVEIAAVLLFALKRDMILCCPAPLGVVLYIKSCTQTFKDIANNFSPDLRGETLAHFEQVPEPSINVWNDSNTLESLELFTISATSSNEKKRRKRVEAGDSSPKTEKLVKHGGSVTGLWIKSSWSLCSSGNLNTVRCQRDEASRHGAEPPVTEENIQSINHLWKYWQVTCSSGFLRIFRIFECLFL